MNFLVAYDGSPGAQRAAREVAPLASAAGATLMLLHVLDPRVDASHVQAPTTREAMAEVTRQVQAEAQEFGAGLMDGVKVRVEAVQRGEDIPEAILRVAGEEQAAVIAIATKRSGGVAGLVLGSVMQEVLADAQCPVLVVRTR